MSTQNGATLGRIHYRVTLMDGTVLDAHILNADFLRWDRTAAKHGWPKFDAAPMTFATFLSWAALRRTSQIEDGMTWEKFSEEACADVTAITAGGEPLAEDAEPDPVYPFPVAAGPG